MKPKPEGKSYEAVLRGWVADMLADLGAISYTSVQVSAAARFNPEGETARLLDATAIPDLLRAVEEAKAAIVRLAAPLTSPMRRGVA